MRKHKRSLYERLSKLVLVTHGKKVVRVETMEQMIRLYGNPKEPFQSYHLAMLGY
jgi:hypothetical protein